LRFSPLKKWGLLIARNMEEFVDIPDNPQKSRLPVYVGEKYMDVYRKYFDPLISLFRSGEIRFELVMYGPNVTASVLHDNMRRAAFHNFKAVLVNKGYIYEEAFVEGEIRDILEGMCIKGTRIIRII
jgi:hypothetical protein